MSRDTRRFDGFLLLALGAVATIAPLFSSVWGVAIVGAAIFLSGIVELADAYFSGNTRTHYSSGVFSVLAGALISLQSAFAFSGLMVVLSLVLLADGGVNVVRAVRGNHPVTPEGRGHGHRLWDLINGTANILLAVLVWWLRDSVGPLGFGVLLGLRMAASGWQTIFAPSPSEADVFTRPEDHHPSRGLGLEPHPIIGFIHREAIADAVSRAPTDLYWSAIFVLVFFAIHVGRLDAEWTWLGLLSPAVATLGDIAAALVLAVVIVFPASLLWARVTRPVERAVWQRMLHDTSPVSDLRWSERGLRTWAELRLRRHVARDLENNTLPGALRQMIRAGLPITAVIIAVHPIWGFSWYFNSENWATAAWQKIAQTRIDVWRTAMIDAVAAARGGGDLTAPGVFAVTPPGLTAEGDFSFIVIGDPGEGDQSQHALRDQVLAAGRKDAVKFVVIASDVVYPTGAMKDYEANFYLPLKGIDKPVYAIPGNHDWFNALDGFSANLLHPDTATIAIEARVDADLSLSSTTGGRIAQLVGDAARLRSFYRVPAGQQHGPFFELHTGTFSLIAVDTGIEPGIDGRQLAWLNAALDRARGAFTMAILGHPFYASGREQHGDESFTRLRELLQSRGVRVLMAGDTHDFEYYRDARTSPPMHHFVNGGGGAYLSIGTALDWPEAPVFDNHVFYPRSDALSAKLDAETPAWKWPAWWWVRRFGAWPFSVEALSAVFDFNRAPFFQSFVEVRVERSQSRVVFAVIGVDGPLRWRDVQAAGDGRPAGAQDDDVVEFVVAMDAR
ncbi:MAG TPA: metallophosphoesterase [Vicinamibacterales bacterium]|nr:metallophosphoesterase [Vicinamibacterales bacterium]